MTKERMQQLFNGNETLAICVGSWKAYNECNNHSLGTCFEGHFYIDFTELENEEELYEVLTYLGWSELEQEELFIQDYCSTSGIDLGNCDYFNPAELIRIIKENNIETEDDLIKVKAIMEHIGDSFESACSEAHRYEFYEGKTAEEWVREIDEDNVENALDNAGLGHMRCYISIDWEEYARDCEFDGNIHETEDGLLVSY